MKILLVAINAKYIHSNLAVHNLKAYASKYADEIEIAEFTINHRQDYILEEIYKKKPDMVAISCYIWNFQYVKEITMDLNKLLPSVPIWLGGPEVSYDASALLEGMQHITGIMYGEGEKTFLELSAHYIEKSSELAYIRGIVFRKDSGSIATNPPQKLMNLDEIPFCYTDLERFQNKIIYYETSRGCPFSCSYCLSSIDKKVRFRSTSLVKEELAFFMEHKVPQVKFVDRTFNCNAKHSREIWTYLAENDNQVTNFHFEIGADLLTEEDLELMSKLRPGLIQLEIGVQSTNEQTIREIDRAMDFSALKVVVEKINSFQNIHQHLDLIAGLPYEGYESFRKSFNDVYALQPEQLQLGFLKVLKGSNMHRKAEEYGIVYHSNPVYEVLYTKWLNYDELLQIKKVEEMVELYYNSNQFTQTLELLIQSFDTPFDLYRTLGDFYEEKGYAGISQSRMTRYEILLEFAVIVDEKNVDIYKERLIYDLYLRENLKSRPNWAADLSGYKEKIKEFYRREETERKYLLGYEDYHWKQISKMTHMEVFSAKALQLTQAEGKVMVLFDYNKRNPLTYEAFTQIAGGIE
ncbi:B12-binding domain-containing radical SAM protein [Konateibacter massiliensis]|uniref:B12-binding domain-containing radical SAM protein n=1 Tax=Konateibacter massiliensis TaxID=2002841 RepID=UPI000C1514B5|nr:B12-binding domain-containing radical SAM protein [Konateibacter massiliensis]